MSLQVWLPLNGNLVNKGLNNIITTNTPTFVDEGKMGKSLSLSPRVTFNGMKKMNQFTVTFWLKVNSCTSDWADSLGIKSVQADGASASDFRFEATKTSRGCSYHNNSPYAITSASDILITEAQKGEWHHCGVGYNGTNIYIYIDGIQKYTHSGLGGYIIDRFHIGETNNITGAMSDLRIYDECLSQKAIKELYKGLVVHYKLSGTGSESKFYLADVSGNNYNLKSTGSFNFHSGSPRYDTAISPATNASYLTSPAINYSGFKDNCSICWWSKKTDMTGRMAWGFSDGNRLNIYPTSNVFCCNTGDSASNPYQDTNGNSVTFTSYNNGWHHYAMTMNGTDNKLYIDGIYKGKAKTYKNITGTTIYISGWNSGTDYKWVDGDISDFRIYSTVLSDNDILSLVKTSGAIDNNKNCYAYEFIEEDE